MFLTVDSISDFMFHLIIKGKRIIVLMIFNTKALKGQGNFKIRKNVSAYQIGQSVLTTIPQMSQVQVLYCFKLYSLSVTYNTKSGAFSRRVYVYVHQFNSLLTLGYAVYQNNVT